MPQTLLVYYKSDTNMLVAAINEQGQLSEPPALLSFDELQEQFPNAQASLLLDSMLLHFARIALPGTNRIRQLQAAPYALEDQLACDIDTLHFTLGKRDTDDLIAVVCVDKNLLSRLLQKFSRASISLTSVCPDLLALPLAEQQWPVLIDQDRVCIRSSEQSGFACERDNLPMLLPTLLQQNATPPQTLLVLSPADENSTDAISALFNGCDIPRVHQSYPHSVMQLLALHVSGAQSMNLLQGNFAVKRQTSLPWQVWRIAAVAAAIWLVLQLLTAVLEIRMLDTINQQLTSEIETEFKNIFPDAKKFSGMQSRVKNRLKQLRGGGDDNQEIYLNLLAAAAPALVAEGLSIHNIAYRERHLDMELRANSLAILEAAKSRLDAEPGIKAVLSTSLEKDKVLGRLRIEAASAVTEKKPG